jgi:hypothetical protein
MLANFLLFFGHYYVIFMKSTCQLCTCDYVIVATLALGSWPRQRLAKVWAKTEVRESHFMLSGVWENVREWTSTFLSELPFWELDSRWTPEFSQINCRSQNPLDWGVPYTIGKLLELKCLKWAHMTHLDIKTQVMAKRRVGSQIVNLTPDH